MLNLSKKAVTRIGTALFIMLAMPGALFAADDGGDVLLVIQNLTDLMFTLLRAIGIILVGFGLLQVGLSLQSHDPSQRSNAFMFIAGGLIIVFIKQILSVIIPGGI